MNLRRLVHRIFNRFTVIVILVALQGFIFAQILLHWSNFYVQISEALKVISILAVYYLIYKQENPSIKLAWIVPILLSCMWRAFHPVLEGIRDSTSAMDSEHYGDMTGADTTVSRKRNMIMKWISWLKCRRAAMYLPLPSTTEMCR